MRLQSLLIHRTVIDAVGPSRADLSILPCVIRIAAYTTSLLLMDIIVITVVTVNIVIVEVLIKKLQYHPHCNNEALRGWSRTSTPCVSIRTAQCRGTWCRNSAAVHGHAATKHLTLRAHRTMG